MKVCSECKKWKSGWCNRKMAASNKDDKPCSKGEKRV